MESRLIFIPEATKIFQLTSFTNWIFPRVKDTGPLIRELSFILPPFDI